MQQYDALNILYPYQPNTFKNGSIPSGNDADNGFAGAPGEPLAVGASVDFKWGISCPSKAGDDLKITLQVAGIDIYEAKGKLA